MVRNGEIGLAEVKRVLRRYWWIVPISALGCGALALAAALVLPKKFTSTTLVLVDQPTVPAEYVRPVITEDLNHRLSSMQEQILSRTRLQPIIDKFGLYAEDRGKVHTDDLLDRLRAAVQVEPMAPMPGTQNRQLPGFYVKVTFPNPRIAQQICTEITSMFMEQNARDREGQATRTTSFLSSQLDEAKAKLDEQDAKLAQFKRQHLGELPEESQANLSLLTGLNTQLEANTQQLSHAQQEKTYTETLLSQQIANWKATLTGQNPVTVDQQIASLQEQLAAMEARYTPQHPDVIKLKNNLEELKKRNADPSHAPAVSSPSQSATEPANIQELRARLRQADLLIVDLTKREGQIQGEIRMMQARVQATPVVEQQFKEITRSYQTALDFYNELLKKRDNSAMATDLEHQQESEQFRVLDPPSLPSEPSFPKKTLFAGGGLGAGLAISLALLYLLAMSDKSLHTERDVELALKLPVLALVPVMELAGTEVPRSGVRDLRGAMSRDE